MTHLSFPVAETAVHGTLAGDKEEDPVRIMVGQTRNRRQPLFVQGVVKASMVGEFLPVRHGLFVEGVIFFTDEAKVIGVDAHRILPRNLFDVFRLAGL
jgi:hypothetical protein